MEKSNENDLTDLKKVSPKATKWLWGIFLFMFLMFLVTACLKTSNLHDSFQEDSNKYNEVNTLIAYNDLIGARKAVESLSDDNLLKLYVESKIAYNSERYSKAKELLKMIEAIDPNLIISEKLDGFLTFRNIVTSSVESESGI